MKRIVTIFTIACVLLSMSMLLPVSAATVDFSVNFDDEPDGATADETLLGEEFIMSTGTPSSGATVEPDENGGSLLAMTGYTDIKSITYFDVAYTFSVDLITSATSEHGVFVKSVEPDEFILIENPKNANTLQTFDFYEWDWYKENGGAAQATSNIGGSGIFVMLGDGIIKIGVKTYQPDGLTVATETFDLPAPEGYQIGERCTIQIKDDITTVSVSINGTPLAVIELSEPGTEYEGDDPVYGFYKTAVVKDAAGTTLGTVENTRVCSEYSLVAITTRNKEVSIDNVPCNTKKRNRTSPKRLQSLPAKPMLPKRRHPAPAQRRPRRQKRLPLRRSPLIRPAKTAAIRRLLSQPLSQPSS